MDDKPNILLIYTDQQRYDTIRSLGASWMHTPNLDALCETGVVYTQATCPSPVCMPDRWSLHTGQWTSRHRCFSNHHPGPKPEFSLPGLLSSVGYRTGLVGKNHSYLSEADFDTWDPAPQKAFYEALAARNRTLSSDAFDGRTSFGPASRGIESDPEYYKTNGALEFMNMEDERPFFLWLSYLNPHTPYVATEPFFSLYDDRELPAPQVEAEGLEAAGKPFRQSYHRDNTAAFLPYNDEKTMHMRRSYYAMVSLIDHEIGRIVAFLEDHGLRENTLILFTSDHGDYMGDHGLLTKSPALYDCLVRVPFILNWPGTLPRGTSCDDFVSHIDILPALAAVAGACDVVPEGVQGRDFLSCLDSGEAIRPAAYAEYGIPGVPYDPWRLSQSMFEGRPFCNPGDPLLPWEGNPVALSGRIRMIRTHEWKLIDEPKGTGELYDLIADPHELRNEYRNPAHHDVISRLTRMGDTMVPEFASQVV